MSTSSQTMVDAINAGMAEAELAMALATKELQAVRAQRDELMEALERLASQVNDACGVMAEYVAMPCASLRDKFPTTIARTRSRLNEARIAIANVEGRL